MLLTVVVALVLCVLEITALVVASPMMKPSFLLSFLPEDIRLAAKDGRTEDLTTKSRS